MDLLCFNQISFYNLSAHSMPKKSPIIANKTGTIQPCSGIKEDEREENMKRDKRVNGQLEAGVHFEVLHSIYLPIEAYALRVILIYNLSICAIMIRFTSITD